MYWYFSSALCLVLSHLVESSNFSINRLTDTDLCKGLNISSCINLQVNIESEISADVFTSVANEAGVDDGDIVRRLEFKISKRIEASDLNRVGDLVDSFLQSRPWWIVKREVYSWNWDKEHVIILDRIKSSLAESKLREIANAYFTDYNHCLNTPMMVSAVILSYYK